MSKDFIRKPVYMYMHMYIMKHICKINKINILLHKIYITVINFNALNEVIEKRREGNNRFLELLDFMQQMHRNFYVKSMKNLWGIYLNLIARMVTLE